MLKLSQAWLSHPRSLPLLVLEVYTKMASSNMKLFMSFIALWSALFVHVVLISESSEVIVNNNWHVALSMIWINRNDNDKHFHCC